MGDGSPARRPGRARNRLGDGSPSVLPEGLGPRERGVWAAERFRWSPERVCGASPPPSPGTGFGVRHFPVSFLAAIFAFYIFQASQFAPFYRRLGLVLCFSLFSTRFHLVSRWISGILSLYSRVLRTSFKGCLPSARRNGAIALRRQTAGGAGGGGGTPLGLLAQAWTTVRSRPEPVAELLQSNHFIFSSH